MKPRVKMKYCTFSGHPQNSNHQIEKQNNKNHFPLMSSDMELGPAVSPWSLVLVVLPPRDLAMVGDVFSCQDRSGVLQDLMGRHPAFWVTPYNAKHRTPHSKE